MEEFRTLFEIPENQRKIDFQCQIISIGSCFSENIGAKLAYYKFPVIINPFGILYNPESIANSLEFLLNNKTFAVKDLFEHQGIWNSFYHHSRFSKTNKDEALTLINSSLQAAAKNLKNTNFLLITFGTAWVYRHNSSGKIVSNCHKIPAKEFTRYKLTVQEIFDRYNSIIKVLKELNPTLNIIFTVSPVRHLRDGADQNQLSKATLVMAVHELASKFENTSYFPSYEIMMDDLRDYRFYNQDMIHPSPLAINYIWDKFSDSVILPAAKKTMAEIDKINLAIQHRAFQPLSDSHQKFLKSTLTKIEAIENQNPTVNFSKEKELLRQNII